MFSKLKHLKDLRSQAKQMQNVLSQESTIIEKRGVRVEMNGNLEITKLTIEENLSKNSIEENVRDNVNDAIKKTQKIMAQKMQEMGGFDKLGL